MGVKKQGDAKVKVGPLSRRVRIDLDSGLYVEDKNPMAIKIVNSALRVGRAITGTTKRGSIEIPMRQRGSVAAGYIVVNPTGQTVTLTSPDHVDQPSAITVTVTSSGATSVLRSGDPSQSDR